MQRNNQELATCRAAIGESISLGMNRMRFASDQPHQTRTALTQQRGDLGGISRFNVFHGSSVLRLQNPSILFLCNQYLRFGGVLVVVPQSTRKLTLRLLHHRSLMSNLLTLR